MKAASWSIIVTLTLSSTEYTTARHQNSRIKNTLPLRGGSSQSSWQTNVQKPYNSQQQRQQYPIVEDISEGSAKDAMSAFLSRNDRNLFISRVYGILTAQLLVTCLSIFGFSANRDLSVWMMTKGRAVPLLSLLVSSITVAIMTHSERARRESPLKWKLLGLFTAGEALSVGLISSFFSFKTVMSAMTATAAATGSITMYTMLQTNPKYDLSQWGAGLSSAGVIFLFYGLLHLLELLGIIPKGFLPYSELLYSAAGATLFSFYLAYHTRLIVAGKHSKYQMNEKDYIFGAVTLYSDIISIFIYLLRIMDEDRNDRRR